MAQPTLAAANPTMIASSPESLGEISGPAWDTIWSASRVAVGRMVVGTTDAGSGAGGVVSGSAAGRVDAATPGAGVLPSNCVVLRP